MGTEFPGQHEQDGIVIGDELQRLPFLFLPGLCQGKGKRPVHPAAPEGVQDHLFEVTASAGLFHMLDQKVMTVRQRAARGILLEF